MTMKVLITGAAGLVGAALTRHCRARGDEVFAFDREGLDITDERAVRETFRGLRPDAAVNCAAWTDVDGCELDPQRAFLVNSQGVEVLATAARMAGASFVQISTDYVFDGRKAEGFYTQRDDPVAADSLRRPAPRPRNSRMRCLLSEAIGLAPLRDWREALRDFAELSQ